MPTALHVLGTAEVGGTGIARMVTDLGRGLRPYGYDVEAWFTGTRGPLIAELAAAGIPARHVPWEGGWKDPVGLLRLASGLRMLEPSILHQHAGGSSLRALARTLVPRMRIVSHLHGIADERRADFQAAAIQSRFVDAVIACCNAARIPEHKSHLIYAGVQTPQIERQPAGIVGYAGRLAPVKGVAVLIEAFSRLLPHHPTIVLEIAGDGPERARAEELAKALGVDASVRFLGWQTDLAPCWSRWNVLALPSLSEGVPITLLEGMAAGMPVVASRTGGIPEVVQHGISGLLSQPGSASELAVTLGGILSDPGLAQRLGRAARSRVMQAHTAAQFSSAVCALYDSLSA